MLKTEDIEIMTPAATLLFICFQTNRIHFIMQISNEVCKKVIIFLLPRL
jgi:hypothetical protein